MKFLAIVLFLLSAVPVYAQSNPPASGSTTVTRQTSVERDEDSGFDWGLLGLLGLAGLAGLAGRKKRDDTLHTYDSTRRHNP
jgi:MYXO-CTERM domain-containing protein